MGVVEKERIGAVDENHQFLYDNEYIHGGYRLYFNTSQKILKSLFLLHNETVNIWTHIFGGLLFICLLLYFIFSTDYSSNSAHYMHFISGLEHEFHSTKAAIYGSLTKLISEIKEHPLCDTFESTIYKALHEILLRLDENEAKFNAEVQIVKRWPLLVFLLSAIICLVLSSVCHLFGAHSKETKKLVNSLDYAGISILIPCSFFPPIYYIFFCYDYLVYAYLSTISVSSLLVLYVSFSQEFQKPHYRWFRGSLFLTLGLFGIVPTVHIALL